MRVRQTIDYKFGGLLQVKSLASFKNLELNECRGQLLFIFFRSAGLKFNRPKEH